MVCRYTGWRDHVKCLCHWDGLRKSLRAHKIEHIQEHRKNDAVPQNCDNAFRREEFNFNMPRVSKLVTSSLDTVERNENRISLYTMWGSGSMDKEAIVSLSHH